jgi:hypothetical protein
MALVAVTKPKSARCPQSSAGIDVSICAEKDIMARWPRQVWTSIITYLMIFGLFPLLCFVAWAWVRGWI